MSKFFATGDSESESDDQFSDEDEGIVVDDRLITNRFVYSSSESEDEGKRVVRSEKDKRLEELRAVIRAMRNHLKIADWQSIQKDFDALQSALEKAKNVLIDRSKAALVTPTAPHANIALPPFVLQSIHTVDESQKEAFTNKEAKKRMSGPNAKALNSMKQRIRKFVALYGTQFEKFVEDPKNREEAEGEDKGGEEKEEKEEKVKGGKPTAKKAAAAAAAKKGKKAEDSDEESEEESDDDLRSKFAKKKPPPAKKKKPAESEEEEDDDEEEEEEEDEDSDDEGGRKPAKKAAAKKAASAPKKAAAKKKVGDDDDDDDEDDDEEEEEDESDDDGEEVNLNAGGNQAMFTREFWVKKQKDESEDSDSSDDEAREERAKRRNQAKAEKKRRDEQASVARALTDGQTASDKSKSQEMNPEQVIKKLKELLAMRGKRGTDKLAMIADLKLLASKATEPAALLKVHTTLASALFDVTLNKNTHMPTPLWKECEEEVRVILGLLTSNTQVRLSEDEKVEEKFDEDEDDEEVAVAAAAGISMAGIALTEEEKAAKEKKEEEEKAKREDNEDLHTTGEAGRVQYVMGNLFSFLQLLCMEYRKSMQAIDAHTEEYIARLKDELVLEALVGKAQEYYRNVGKTSLEASVAFLRLELVYYKYSSDADVLKQRLLAIKAAGKAISEQSKERDEEKKKMEEEKVEEAAPPAFTIPPPPVNIADQGLVGQLATFLYKHGSDQSRVRALLMHVYHLSLHNQYLAARDMLLMSHIHETVQHADIKTQVLFNRAICQLGLCAFRCGEFRSALEQLGDLVQSNKIRELLAQGTSQQRWQERDVEKEELEKKRQLPFHMHINQDYIEAVHLISAMLAEVPNFAQHGSNNKKKIISKAFRRLFDATARQAFNGPPENTRDLIMAATRAMRGGEWEKCVEFLLRLRMWSWMSKEIAEYAQGKLRVKVQEETLKTYLLTYSQHFQSISSPSLCQLFDLPAHSVHRIASKLITSQQLSGSWDQPSDTIVIHAAQPSKLQRAALTFAEKTGVLLEQNERMLESRHGFVQFNRGGYRGGMGGGDGRGGDGGDRRGDGDRGRGRGRGGYRGGGGDRGRGGGFRGGRGGRGGGGGGRGRGGDRQ